MKATRKKFIARCDRLIGAIATERIAKHDIGEVVQGPISMVQVPSDADDDQAQDEDLIRRALMPLVDRIEALEARVSVLEQGKGFIEER